jgi:hypothetical protein
VSKNLKNTRLFYSVYKAMGMKVTDLRPGNFEKACGFFSLFIFLTILLGGKYSSRSKHELLFTLWNYIQLAISIKVGPKKKCGFLFLLIKT